MIQLRDNGIIGAFMLYLDDKDLEGLKARVIHKVLSPSNSRENRGGAISTATTAGM